MLTHSFIMTDKKAQVHDALQHIYTKNKFETSLQLVTLTGLFTAIAANLTPTGISNVSSSINLRAISSATATRNCFSSHPTNSIDVLETSLHFESASCVRPEVTSRVVGRFLHNDAILGECRHEVFHRECVFFVLNNKTQRSRAWTGFPKQWRGI